MFVRTLLQVVVVVAIMLVVTTALVVGRTRFAVSRREYLRRLRLVAPATVVLAVALLFNGIARQVVPDVSWIIDWTLTWEIYALEGKFIYWLQSFETPALTAFFSFVYIYGYVFVLLFPVIAYVALSNTRPLRELFTAYTLNYLLGLVCYVLVVAYGPRNIMPDLVEALLYDTYPQYQHLTRQVNRNTNVFPSLHTSLAVTVSVLAHRTRAIYPRWYPIAVGLGVSIAISTMYLGIHWAVDVVAGVVLAWLSVVLASRLVGRWSLAACWTHLARRFGRTDSREGDGSSAHSSGISREAGARRETVRSESRESDRRPPAGDRRTERDRREN